jgi:hypothetical protein
MIIIIIIIIVYTFVSPAIPSVQLRLTIEEAQIDRETAR